MRGRARRPGSVPSYRAGRPATNAASRPGWRPGPGGGWA